MLQEETLQKIVNERYAGWNSELGQHILQGKTSLETLAQLVQQKDLAPKTSFRSARIFGKFGKPSYL